jgi:hypothetical protein
VQVVEVKASGILNGLLQFPAITGLRDDKFKDEVDTYEDVQNYGQKIRARKRVYNGDDVIVIPAKNRRRSVANKNPRKSTANIIPNLTLTGKNVWAIDDAKGKARKLFDECKKILVNFGVELYANYCKSNSTFMGNNFIL